MKTAIITGITGQDGSYLAELLLEKGYMVYGIVRRSSSFNTGRIEHLHQGINGDHPNLKLVYADLSDASSLNKLISDVKPDEVYNLAAQSHVRISFDIPEYTGDVTGLGAVRILEAIKLAGLASKTKFYQASTSELFGKAEETPQNENTPFHPRSPYGVAKLYAHWITKNYRESYNMFASTGILFNHESPRRGENFVTKKITQSVARISLGLQKDMSLGNLDAKRDWGFAKDYVECMWRILQQDKSDDYVIATGETHTVREFLEESFNAVGIKIKSNGKKGVDEEYLNEKTGEVVVKINPRFFRPAEVDLLLGDPTKAKNELGWKIKTTFKDLIKIMIEADLKELKK
jgi:GDPmannose 4,6-dehydratase